jgi:hypothetical protein
VKICDSGYLSFKDRRYKSNEKLYIRQIESKEKHLPFKDGCDIADQRN